MSTVRDTDKRFDLPGSRAHYAPSITFTIDHARLELEPDFQRRSIRGTELLTITALEERDILELDAAELDVESVKMDGKTLSFRLLGDRLRINLGRKSREDETFHIEVKYSASPRRGFYFVGPDSGYPEKRLEAWTQGEATESKFWFPTIDHPQVKFTSELVVNVPDGMVAISNGRLTRRSGQNFHWSDEDPHPAYLTSLVIGKYAEVSDGSLFYYVPEQNIDDLNRSFERTPEMLRFFEDYFGVKYPFRKYSQVTVQDFIFGGMENSSCTTLTLDTLHDEKAHLDFTSDHLVSHELAHQWFGDLVTCRDWQHIWLNEGFATYCEALYWESSRGLDEFHYYVMQTSDDYLEEAATRYVRPIVTKTYKHPDELFDRHTYEKGGVVLHMLRREVGDARFRRAVGAYLRQYANGNAETDDLRRVFELQTGRSLQEFFDQWLYRSGHPELKVEFSESSSIAKLKIAQEQQGEPFDFQLEVRFVTQDGVANTHVLPISGRETEFQIPVASGIDWFSVDSEFKVLKSIKLKAPKELLVNQLRKGITVLERVEAARALRSESATAVVDSLRDAVMHDPFWGVAAEAAKALGNLRTDYAYRTLIQCLSVPHPKTRRAVIKSLGEFRKSETVGLLNEIIEGDPSYFVQSEAATAIGKTRDGSAVPLLKRAVESSSFQNIIAQGAIAGLKEFADDNEIVQMLVEKTRYGNHHRVREAGTFALAKCIPGNRAVFEHLKTLLTDSWFRVRINACRAFADADQVKAIPDLTWVSENDLDHRVRRVAEECIAMIRQSTAKPTAVTSLQDEVDSVKAKNLELMQKMDRLERQLG